MPTSSNEEVKNKLKNRFYSQILIHLNIKEMDGTSLSKILNKTQATMSRQLNALEKDNLLFKKSEGNKLIFYINWEELEKKVKETLQERRDVIDKLNLEYEKEVIRLNKLLNMKNNPNNIKEVQDVPIKRDTKTF